MKIGVLQEMFPGERRVALTPISAAALIKKGHEICVESDAGKLAGFLDEAYASVGCSVCAGPADVIGRTDVLPAVFAPPAVPKGSPNCLEHLTAKHTVIGFAHPVTAAEGVRWYPARTKTMRTVAGR